MATNNIISQNKKSNDKDQDVSFSKKPLESVIATTPITIDVNTACMPHLEKIVEDQGYPDLNDLFRAMIRNVLRNPNWLSMEKPLEKSSENTYTIAINTKMNQILLGLATMVNETPVAFIKKQIEDTLQYCLKEILEVLPNRLSWLP